MNNTISKEALVSSLRTLSSGLEVEQTPTTGNEQFSSILHQAIRNVSDRQLQASDLTAKFEHGDASVSLADVMIEIQKARVSFEALSQVRNKFVTAYQQIMSMPL